MLQEAMRTRFIVSESVAVIWHGPKVVDPPFQHIARMVQNGSMNEYYKHFSPIMCLAADQPVEQQTGCFASDSPSYMERCNGRWLQVEFRYHLLFVVACLARY